MVAILRQKNYIYTNFLYFWQFMKQTVDVFNLLVIGSFNMSS